MDKEIRKYSLGHFIDKSLNQDDDLSMNCVKASILPSTNLSPKFPNLPKMRGFKIASINICSLTCHHDELCLHGR